MRSLSAFFGHTMKPAMRKLLWLGLLGGVCAVGGWLWLRVPANRQLVKDKKHVLECPDVPEDRSRKNGADWSDPAVFGTTQRVNRATLRFNGKELAVGGESPAITRSVGDVADKLTSISLAADVRSDSADPGIRFIIRIDHADGSLAEWNEKELRADEHSPGTWERMTFEWLLRELSVAPSDQVSVFILSDDPMRMRNLDVVYRSGRTLKADPRDA